MKGNGFVLAFAVLFVSGVALAATTPLRAVKGEEHHHLLMLDVREAADHAKTLNHYAGTHPRDLDKAVLAKHLDELTRNLEGVKTELAAIEQKIEPADKVKVDKHLSTIRTQEQTAWQDLETLKSEVAKEAPDASVIEFKSKAILTAMRAADDHQHQMMVKRGVHEPREAVKS